MKYKNFEKQLSESFLQDSAAVDTDALIASLGIPVAVEKDPKIAWWMVAGFALLSLVLVGAYYYIQSPNTTEGDTAATKDSTVAAIEKNDNLNNDIATIVEVEPIEEDAEEDEIISDIKKSQTKSINNTNEASVASKENTYDYQNTSVVVGNTMMTSGQNTTVKNIAATNVSNSITTSSNTENKAENTNVVSDKASANVTVSGRVLDPILSIDPLSVQLQSQKEYPGLADPECPSFSYRIPWNIALLAEIGVMKPMKELQSDNAPMDSAFVLRNMNETSKEAIQIGLHAKISKGSNPLYIRGGIAYTRIAEQMNESYDYTEQDTMRGLVSITTSMTGDTVTAIYGDVISETRYTGRSVKHYYLHLWDLPIAVGYEIPVAGSLYMGGEVGAQFNFRTSGSGLIFRDVNDYADLSEVSNKETKVGMSYFGGLHFGKHLSKRSSIQLSARFRYYPSKFSTVDPNIKQRYNLAGLHAGYVYRF